MDQKILKQLEELQNIVAKMATNMVTKKEAKDFATKDDLKNFATKDDLKQLKTELIEEIKDSEAFIVASADRNKAEKSVVEDLQRRVIKIERKLAAAT
jgi:predicted nucleic acid-binding OB-fold protein